VPGRNRGALSEQLEVFYSRSLIISHSLIVIGNRAIDIRAVGSQQTNLCFIDAIQYTHLRVVHERIPCIKVTNSCYYIYLQL